MHWNLDVRWRIPSFSSSSTEEIFQEKSSATADISVLHG